MNPQPHVVLFTSRIKTHDGSVLPWNVLVEVGRSCQEVKHGTVVRVFWTTSWLLLSSMRDRYSQSRELAFLLIQDGLREKSTGYDSTKQAGGEKPSRVYGEVSRGATSAIRPLPVVRQCDATVAPQPSQRGRGGANEFAVVFHSPAWKVKSQQ